MGCGNSKQKLCRNCKSSYPTLLRSYSMQSPSPALHQKEADNNHHTVVLTSSTLGPLTVKLNMLDDKHHENSKEEVISQIEIKEEIFIGKISDEPRIWSKLMDQKVKKIVPRTPTKTPTGKPEIINAWELMEGLDENSPVITVVNDKPPFHNYTRSFSFHFSSYQSLDDDLTPTIEQKGSSLDGKDQLIAPLQEFLKTAAPAPVDDIKKSLQVIAGENTPPAAQVKEKLIVYFTSLRGVRKTYDDCCDVRRILKQLGVKVDERDVSMASVFKTELKDLLYNGPCSTNEGSIGLPKVFIGRRCVGGIEEIRRMYEEGELRKAVDGVAVAEDDGAGVCEVCGDIRFVPCGTCYGSCKVYNESDYEKSVICGFLRCHDCNENGLVCCPMCTGS